MERSGMEEIVRKPPVILIASLLLVLTIGCGISSSSPQTTGTIYPDTAGFEGAGFTFVYAVGYRDEEKAISMLSDAALLAVDQYCEGKVLVCLDEIDLGQPEDIEIGDVVYLPSYAAGSYAMYAINLEERDGAVFVVLNVITENNEWKINGWRGWIFAEAGPPQGLLDGTDTSNLFPPE